MRLRIMLNERPVRPRIWGEAPSSTKNTLRNRRSKQKRQIPEHNPQIVNGCSVGDVADEEGRVVRTRQAQSLFPEAAIAVASTSSSPAVTAMTGRIGV